MITCIQRGNGITYFDVPVHKSLDSICKNLEYGSTIFTNEYRAYEHLEEYGFSKCNPFPKRLSKC